MKRLSSVQPLSLISTHSLYSSFACTATMLSTTVFTLTALLVVSASASPLVVSRQLSSAGWAYKGCFTEATGRKSLSCVNSSEGDVRGMVVLERR